MSKNKTVAYLGKHKLDLSDNQIKQLKRIQAHDRKIKNFHKHAEEIIRKTTSCNSCPNRDIINVYEELKKNPQKINYNGENVLLRCPVCGWDITLELCGEY